MGAVHKPDFSPRFYFLVHLNVHTHCLIPGVIFGYNHKCTFGRLRFNTTLPDPEVTYDIISIDNELIYSFPLRLSAISGS